ncbi:hypothetical protein Bca4012_095224 [Brassica carinata]|uniref:Uncharacterized protein n=1 Tax=Brassica carinata TaxID=52824 RepID=A0A8X7PWV7_BRACI|nr:hypothetical protein Bca52824_077282 [Brassica carinata]
MSSCSDRLLTSLSIVPDPGPSLFFPHSFASLSSLNLQISSTSLSDFRDSIRLLCHLLSSKGD